MTTAKCDLHTAEYSVQGADAILTSDMEQIDDLIVKREIVTLGEAVTAYKALYQAANGKWYKAQADGVKQPCQGLSLESGIEDGQIRIVRLGEVTNASWNWATIGGQAPVYLSSSTAGELTQSKPSSNVQVIGYPTAATKLLLTLTAAIPEEEGAGATISRGGTVLGPASPVNVIVWRAPYQCTLKKVWGYRVGGTGATVNARKNGSDNHLSSALSLTSANQWIDGGSVQNTSYQAGDKLEIMIVSVDGSPSQVAVQIDLLKAEGPVS